MTTTFERKLIPFIRWIARVVGSLIFAFVILFILGYTFTGHAPDFAGMNPKEQIMFTGLFLEMIGILLAWKWEGIGAGLIIVGYAVFQITEGKLFTPPIFPIFLILGVMFGYCWLRGRRM